MLKSTLTLTLGLAFFLLFSLSHSDSLPSSDLNPIDDLLLLPSDNSRAVVPDDPESAAAVADPKPVITEPDHQREGFVSLPLTKLDFHGGSIPLSLRFPHRRHFGRGCRHGFMGRPGMRPRRIPYGDDMILSDGKDGSQEFLGRSRFHWVNRRPRFEVDAPWKGEELSFERPKKFEHGHDDEEEEIFKKRPKKFRHHDDDDDDDLFKRPKKFDRDEDVRVSETVMKVKHDDTTDHMFRMPRKFKHDDDEDWHREKHHHGRFGRHHHHHKHHHDDDEDDNKGGVLSRMREFFDDLF